ncbi:unnamed protein product [Didymodactylos carnosus]|uniref:Uncharacterized protein n=1 Tax=Didymodactylos carnosus TaxID=1234261 RepID=A0A814XWE0_9BILA|nr:unnamed protein product [Didymodactylos carnosus]CAF3984945.1 unnamed protein product [Didymodactylos carnosus]
MNNFYIRELNLNTYFSAEFLSMPNLKIIPLRNPKRGFEPLVYFQYIVDNYDVLPKHTIFLHGHPEKHNPHLILQLTWLLNAFQIKEMPNFLHLNCNLYTRRIFHKAGEFLHLLGFNNVAFTAIGNLSSKQLAQGYRYFGTECCAQFLVSSELIRQYPVAFYRLALKISEENWYDGPMECMWHAFFLRRQELGKNRNLNSLYMEAHPRFRSRCYNSDESTIVVE